MPRVHSESADRRSRKRAARGEGVDDISALFAAAAPVLAAGRERGVALAPDEAQVAQQVSDSLQLAFGARAGAVLAAASSLAGSGAGRISGAAAPELPAGS